MADDKNDINNMPALMPIYKRDDIYFERGEGCYLYDDKGTRYLDFVAGIAVTSLGHCHPHVTKAIKEQSERLFIATNLFRYHGLEKLAQRLVDLSFADTVWFQNSGAEAWECSIKLIRKYFSTIGQPQRYRVITFDGCFHGRTLAGIAASKAEKMVKGFGPLMDGFDQVPLDNMNELRAAITNETAAICIEPVIGEGGMRPMSDKYLREIRTVCDEFGLLLYFDEVQCGMGRTGKMFAHEWSGVTPDVMSIAKALGNGYPIGACLATAKAAIGMTVGTHGSTYGGNPFAAAVGNAVLDVMTKPGFLDHVNKMGAYLEKKFEELVAKHPKVFKGHRGKGLMRGFTCVPLNTDFTKALLQEKMLGLGARDNVVRFTPALTITEANIDEACAIISKVAKQFEAKAA
jgi:acetylornithine/N-succinyldiaminopimelate aminotransferase